MFGLLVSRCGPNDSAEKARRRAWIEHEKLIVFLDDDDLAAMLQMAEDVEDSGPLR